MDTRCSSPGKQMFPCTTHTARTWGSCKHVRGCSLTLKRRDFLGSVKASACHCQDRLEVSPLDNREESPWGRPIRSYNPQVHQTHYCDETSLSQFSKKSTYAESKIQKNVKSQLCNGMARECRHMKMQRPAWQDLRLSCGYTDSVTESITRTEKQEDMVTFRNSEGRKEAFSDRLLF